MLKMKVLNRKELEGIPLSQNVLIRRLKINCLYKRIENDENNRNRNIRWIDYIEIIG